MPRWVSTLLIVAGFFALVGLAFMPRFVEIHIVYDESTSTVGGAGDHGAPAPIPQPEE